MGKEGRNSLLGKVFRGCLQLQEMLGERDDIFWPFAQRRNSQLKLAKAVKQILAEAALAHRGLKVLVGSGDNADVNLDLAMPTQTVERLSIKHAHQLHLCLQLQFPD